MDLEKMKERAESLWVRIQTDREEYQKLQESIWNENKRQALLRLVGIADGVTISFCCSAERLRGRKATVIKVNRTRSLVSIDGEQWFFPFDLIKFDSNDVELERGLNESLQG
jgi:spore coat protein CotH